VSALDITPSLQEPQMPSLEFLEGPFCFLDVGSERSRVEGIRFLDLRSHFLLCRVNEGQAQLVAIT
jgi:hypothetical protein